MTPMPSQSEVVAFMAAYPSEVLEAISLYYPLSAALMLKYGDILSWGAQHNVDISDCASQDCYEPGIIFNHSVEWTDEIRSIVTGHLALKGGDFALDGIWGSNEDECGRRTKSLIDLVTSCPLPRRFPLDAETLAHWEHEKNLMDSIYDHLDLDEYRAVEDYESQRLSDYLGSPQDRATITSALSWDELKTLFIGRSLPSLLQNPELWNKNLAVVMNESVVEQLLMMFYWQHLNGVLQWTPWRGN
jgi:hypothetical protein